MDRLFKKEKVIVDNEEEKVYKIKCLILLSLAIFIAIVGVLLSSLP